MRRCLVVILGVVSSWPVLYLLAFLTFGLIDFVRMGSEDAFTPVFPFETVYALHVGTIIIAAALTLFYTVHALKNSRLTSDRRMSWIAIMIVTQSIGILAYLKTEIWSRTEDQELSAS